MTTATNQRNTRVICVKGACPLFTNLECCQLCSNVQDCQATCTWHASPPCAYRITISISNTTEVLR